MLETINQLCLDMGIGGLFLLSISASTILPLGSEWLYLVLLRNHQDLPHQLSILFVATLGNTLGGFINFYLGAFSRKFGNETVQLAEDKTARRFPKVFSFINQHGVKLTFWGWLPWIGDPITYLAGLLRLSLVKFLIYSASGRLLRYFVLLVWLRHY